ncbi:MAG: alpha/beta hydrolase family esterase [Alphaproteobacteria bacterium]
MGRASRFVVLLLLVAFGAVTVARADAVRRTLNVGGIEREYLVQLPAQATSLQPLLIVLHGGTRPATDIFARGAWTGVATREGFILVAPQGIDNQWNDGRKQTISGKVSTADDVAFLEAMIAELIARDRVDPARVYLSGASNGGLMTFRFACERAGVVAGIAPTISKMPVALREACKPARPVPVVMIAGTADPLMPYEGAPTGPMANRSRDPMATVPETVAFWAQVNGCTLPAAEASMPDIDASDGTTVTRLEPSACKGAPIVVYRVNGGGHWQPSLSRVEGGGPIVRMLGPQNHDIESAEVIWSFLKSVRR